MKSAIVSLKWVVLAILGAGVGARAQETVLYSFSLNDPAMQPDSALVRDSKGNLYGTSHYAGRNSVFELSPAAGGGWTEQVIDSFDSYRDDGDFPMGGLILDEEGNLYGTTTYGGEYGSGTVFELSHGSDGSRSEKVLYNFAQNTDEGLYPTAGLTFDTKGNLYGTTSYGGRNSSGSVFELVRQPGGDWTESVIWSFGGFDDGCKPEGGVTFDARGNLYGTTATCGTGSSGTVFELSPQAGGGWTEKILYNFCSAASCSDGAFPAVGVIFDKQGNLYGTVARGVYELSPRSDGSWQETVIHTFNSSDGGAFEPQGVLFLDAKGNLFGATQHGGTSESAGVVYELTQDPVGTWSEKTLYGFGSLPRAADGSFPLAGVIQDPDGNLYGTTATGGPNGQGTVYEIYSPYNAGTPTFTPPAGAYTSPQKVALSSYTPRASFYYTTNGDDPTVSSEKYSEPIEVSESETIKAIAVADNLTNSEVASASYIIETPTAEPEITPSTGLYHSVQTVAITDKTPHATIFYTTDGTKPTTSSPKYTAPFRVSQSETISAIAVASDYTHSAIATATYTIDLPPAAAPTISPKSGAYKQGEKITMTATNGGAKIYYTLDGSTPTSNSTLYTSALTLTKAETVKAIATAPGHSKSAVAEAVYTLASQ